MLFTVAAPGLGAFTLVLTHDQWSPLIESLSPTTYLLFIGLSSSLAGLSLIPTHASSLIGGMTFGLWVGPLMALGSVILASILSYFIMKFIIGEKGVRYIQSSPKSNRVYQELLLKSGKQAITFIILLRLSPVMPFAATNLVLAAAKVKFAHFLLGSVIGLAPRVILVAIAGAGLSKLDLSQGSDIKLAILGAVSTLVLIIYLSKVLRKALKA